MWTCGARRPTGTTDPEADDRRRDSPGGGFSLFIIMYRGRRAADGLRLPEGVQYGPQFRLQQRHPQRHEPGGEGPPDPGAAEQDQRPLQRTGAQSDREGAYLLSGAGGADRRRSERVPGRRTGIRRPVRRDQLPPGRHRRRCLWRLVRRLRRPGPAGPEDPEHRAELWPDQPGHPGGAHCQVRRRSAAGSSDAPGGEGGRGEVQGLPGPVALCRPGAADREDRLRHGEGCPGAPAGGRGRQGQVPDPAGPGGCRRSPRQGQPGTLCGGTGR